MKLFLIYVYNICWQSYTDGDDAFYNDEGIKFISTKEYIEIPKDTFFNHKERNEFIDFILNERNGFKPLTHEYSIEYVCEI